MAQNSVHNKMEIWAQHNNSHGICSLSALSEINRCHQHNGTNLPNFHNTAKAEHYNHYTGNSLLPFVGTGIAQSVGYTEHVLGWTTQRSNSSKGKRYLFSPHNLEQHLQ